MPYETIRATLFNHLRTNWTDNATALRTPIAVTNSSAILTRVDGTASIASAPPNAAWLRFNVLGLNDDQADLGRVAHYDIRGRLAIQVFTPIGTGTVASDQYIDQLRTLFTRKSFDLGNETRLDCMAADTPLDGFETGHWWQRNLWIPFKSSEFRAIPA